MTPSDGGSASPGVPTSIAAIMAAIRAEVAARPAVVPEVAEPAAALTPASRDSALAAAPVAAQPGRALPPQIDGEARALLAPLLKAWLDAHLPEIVETAVHAEIRRLTGIAD